MRTPAAPSTARARSGVSLMFFTNGVLYAALLPRYPELKAALGLSNAEFGFVVVAFPMGAIAAATVAAPLIRRIGAPGVTAYGTVVIAGALAAAGSSPTVWGLVLGLAVAGLVDAAVDAGQNVQGIAVERWRGRSIINSLHALWSLGAATGGVIGAVCAAQGVAVGTQLVVNGVLWSAVALVASRLAAVPPDLAGGPEDDAAKPSLAGVWRLLLPLVLLAICGTLVEDVANNWVVLYLGTEGGAPVALAGLGLSTVLLLQFVGRLLGDPMTDRWGRDRVARSGGLLIAGGLVLVVATPWWPLAFVGFGLAGLGSATLVPAAFAAADRVPGLAPGTGIAVLGWLMRLGFLLTSPVVGLTADAASLRTAMGIPLVAGLLAALMAHLTLRRTVRHQGNVTGTVTGAG